ncbi:MAG: 2-C-methyl-D-erythritol 2,4-cyclodiphosphate synthase [Clostridiales bacterium]|nr:2-C-methyl-D-erythritol 2,4-cyclodiphosphate synthase [Clostridiales bacterium]
MNPNVGFGYDIHRFKKGRKLYLGGVEIPHPAGLVGHSDGDCLIHALIDALLGASGDVDIGRLFPDTGPDYKDIRSTELLKRVAGRLRRKKLEVLNVDAVIVAQAPRLAPFVDKMKAVLCPLLRLPSERLGIKAKTNEGIGLVGREKAVACWVVVLVGRKRGERR